MTRLRDVAQAGKAQTCSTGPQRGPVPPDTGGTSHRDDADSLSGEVSRAPSRERQQRDLVAGPLDQHHRVQSLREHPGHDEVEGDGGVARARLQLALMVHGRHPRSRLAARSPAFP